MEVRDDEEGGATVTNLNSSLPVPSVQELVINSHHLPVLPPRYVRDYDRLPERDASRPDLAAAVPTIDMDRLFDADSQSVELTKLHSACRDWGLFQVINHGLPDESMRKLKENVKGFFELPYQEKKRWSQRPGSLEGYGQAFVFSEYQKLDWNDMLFLKCLPAESRQLDLWPERPPHFREALEEYSEGMRRLANCLLKYMGMGLGVDVSDDQFCNGFQEGKYNVRMNYYPVCPEPERAIGISPHADDSGVTFLMECNDTPGLQVLKDGHWVTVLPIKGAVVANLGQMWEIFSNGIYKAPDHRAMVNKDTERVSIVTFCYPESAVRIGPSEQLLIKMGLSPMYQTLTCSDYLHRFYLRKLDSTPFLETLKMR